LKNSVTKKGLVEWLVGPEFKPQYCQQKKRGERGIQKRAMVGHRRNLKAESVLLFSRCF
jgi:hypothetical protein